MGVFSRIYLKDPGASLSHRRSLAMWRSRMLTELPLVLSVVAIYLLTIML